jgi:hypothetical protein
MSDMLLYMDACMLAYMVMVIIQWQRYQYMSNVVILKLKAIDSEMSIIIMASFSSTLLFAW